MALSRLMCGNLHRHRQKMLIITINVALEQRYEVAACCHGCACGWTANPLPASYFYGAGIPSTVFDEVYPEIRYSLNKSTKTCVENQTFSPGLLSQHPKSLEQ